MNNRVCAMKTTGLLLVLLVCAGCNLSREAGPAPVSAMPEATVFPTANVTRTPIMPGITELPTLLPLPASGAVTTAQATLLPVTSVPLLGAACPTYTTYSGADPRNKLSLRSAPAVSAPQVFRVPTGTLVALVPNTQETEGDGYHWLNVIYEEAGVRYAGWMARDSFSTNGVRDPSVATLRPTGSQAPC